MKTNLRKEQEKLAVLLEISDTPKKNSDIIKGAESRLVMDEAYSRLLSDKKTTAGNGVYKGRRRIACDFDKIYSDFCSGVITATRGWELLGISKSSWYRRVREKQQSQPNPQQ